MTSLESGIPESFNVLVKELRSLGFNVELKVDQSKLHLLQAIVQHEQH